MKSLNFEQMENLEGGSWAGCARGAGMLMWASAPYAIALGGWVGLAAIGAVGCIAAQL